MNLFILSSTPYGDRRTEEALDAALAYAAFGQEVNILFTGAGLLQLLPDQNPMHGKNISKILKAFEIYDIEEVYALESDLLKLKLPQEKFSRKVSLISNEKCWELTKSASRIFRF